ncbi:unnamed protein product [Lymnaea stagnalis]|uniref:EF-hand domain-containing protein n=1 Tax=Lymnaea stagnalis TaxID=6523 RepID=A0AAV2H7W0_LYMST
MICTTLVVGFLLILGVVDGQNENLDMMGLINILYMKADENVDGMITPLELSRIYEFMDTDRDNVVSKTEFTTVWRDLTQYDTEVSEAYFFLSDLDGNGVIDRTDNNNIFARFDLNGDGMVQGPEFVTKYTEVYHEVPFVILFERVEKSNNNDQHLTRSEFSQLFRSFTVGGTVIKESFLKTWVDSKFGSVKDAEDVFTSFDANNDDVISTAEVGAKFTGLDKNGNGTIEILEAIEVRAGR